MRTLVTAPRFVLLRLFLQVYLREIPSFTARVSPFSAACALFALFRDSLNTFQAASAVKQNDLVLK